jgi:hypothetical protein
LQQYGVRHYAHAICYLMAGRSIADLTPNQREAFTPDVAKEFVSRILRRHGLDLEGGAL